MKRKNSKRPVTDQVGPGRPRAITDAEEIREVVRLYESGASMASLAKKLGVHPQTLRATAMRNGAKSRRVGRPVQPK